MRVMILPLLSVACAASTAAPHDVVENTVEPVTRTASLEGNRAATVKVYYAWRNPIDNDTLWDSVYGVVVDQAHVIAPTTISVVMIPGWEQAHLESVTIGPCVLGNPESGPWPAKIAATDGSFAVLATSSPIPVAPVVPATAPVGGGNAYMLSSEFGDDLSVAFEGLVVGPEADTDRTTFVGRHRSDVALVLRNGPRSQDAGVFDDRHGFIGLLTPDLSFFVIPKPYVTTHRSRFGRGVGYYVASVHGTLRPLLKQAGVVGYD